MAVIRPASLVISLDHFVLTVRSISASKMWYANNLGMRAETFRSPSAPHIVRHALLFGSQKINLHELGRVNPLCLELLWKLEWTKTHHRNANLQPRTCNPEAQTCAFWLQTQFQKCGDVWLMPKLRWSIFVRRNQRMVLLCEQGRAARLEASTAGIRMEI
jgi:hypothetical protein